MKAFVRVEAPAMADEKTAAQSEVRTKDNAATLAGRLNQPLLPPNGLHPKEISGVKTPTLTH
jgi:hypothetical protein